jgi:hypothetical protein
MGAGGLQHLQVLQAEMQEVFIAAAWLVSCVAITTRNQLAQQFAVPNNLASSSCQNSAFQWPVSKRTYVRFQVFTVASMDAAILNRTYATIIFFSYLTTLYNVCSHR